MVSVVNIYVSHAWSHGDYYDKLFRLVQSEMSEAPQHFGARLHGLPKHDGVHTNPAIDELRSAMRYPMSRSHVLVLPTGLYGRYSKWIDLEIELARGGYEYRRRILAIDLFASDKNPTPVQANADRILAWSRIGIISALRELAAAPAEKVPAASAKDGLSPLAMKQPPKGPITVLPAQFRAPIPLRRATFGRA